MDLYESTSFNSHFLLKPILFSILSSNTQAVLEFQKRLFKPLFVKPYDPEHNFVIEQSDRIPYLFIYTIFIHSDQTRDVFKLIEEMTYDNKGKALTDLERLFDCNIDNSLSLHKYPFPFLLF